MSKRSQHYAFVATKWMTASSYVTFITGALNSVIITHALGPQLYGVYSYVAWLITFVVGLTTGGFNITAIRSISAALGKDLSAPSAEALAIFGTLRRKLLTFLIAAAAALWISTWFPHIYPYDLAKNISFYIVFVIACSAAKALYMFSFSASKGFMAFETEAIGNITTGLITPIIGTLLWRSHQGLVPFMALLGASLFTQLGIAHALMRRRGFVARNATLSQDETHNLTRLLRWNLILSLIAQLNPKSIDTYLLGLMSLTVAVGQYSIAVNLSRAGADVLLAGFSAMLLPYISRVQAQEGFAGVQGVFTTAVCVYQGIGLLLAGAGFLMGDFLILTLYGTPFAGAIRAFQIMSMVSGITLPLGANSAVLIATDSVRLRTVYMLGMVAISLASSLTLVPKLGFEGALISIPVGGALSYLFANILALKVINLRFPIRPAIVQFFCASLAFAASMLVFPNRTTAICSIAATLLFGSTFILLALNLGGWPRKDLDAACRQSKLLSRMLDLFWRRRSV